MSQRQTGKVAHHEVARFHGSYHYGVALFGAYLVRHFLYLRHVLCYLRAEVRAVNDAFVVVGVGPVHRVSVKGEGSTRLHSRFKDKSDYLFYRHNSS